MNKIIIAYFALSWLAFIYAISSASARVHSIFEIYLHFINKYDKLLILFNLIISTILLTYYLFIDIFLLSLKDNQIIKIKSKLTFLIIEFFILIITYQKNSSFITFIIVLFTIFIIIILHLHAFYRAQFIIYSPSTLQMKLNFRMMVMFLVILFIDYQLSGIAMFYIFSDQTFFIIVGFMFINISLQTIHPFIKFSIDFYQKYTFSFIRNKDQKLAFINIIIEIPRILFKSLFAFWIFKNKGYIYFLYLGIISFYQLTKLIRFYHRINKLTSILSKLKSLNKNQILQLQLYDLTCMICFSQIQNAIQLPCKHIFHYQCMRQWIIKNQNNFCPKCKLKFNYHNIQYQNNNQIHHPHQNHIQHQNNNHIQHKYTHSKNIHQNTFYKQQTKMEQNNSFTGIEKPILQHNEQIQPKQYKQKQYNISREINQEQLLQKHNYHTNKEFSIKIDPKKVQKNSEQEKQICNYFRKEFLMKENKINDRWQQLHSNYQYIPKGKTIYPQNSFLIEQTARQMTEIQYPTVGSLPFTPPTSAVNHRLSHHRIFRAPYIQRIHILKGLASLSKHEQYIKIN